MAITREKLISNFDGAPWEVPALVQRLVGGPLDKSSVFFSYDDAVEYAKNNPVAYPGQIIAVVPETGDVTTYVIETNGGLTPIGVAEIDPPPEMEGASEGADGKGGMVPAPLSEDRTKYLRGSGEWDTIDAEDVQINETETLLNFIPIILTQTDYDTLAGGGTITLNGQEISYEENRIYLIKVAKPVDPKSKT